MGQLYLITVTPTGKHYVGITTYSAKKRWKAHCHPKTDSLIARAIRKHGVENCVITILDERESWEELCALEIVAIEKHKTMMPKGYNVVAGGRGWLHTVETRAAISARAKARYADPAERAIQSARSKARYADPAELAVLAAQAKTHWANPAARAAHSAKAKARYTDHTEREAQSVRGKARFADPATRSAAEAQFKTYFSDPEARAAISTRQKARWADPTERAAQSERLKAHWGDPEVKQRSGLALATAWAKRQGRAFSYIPKSSIDHRVDKT